MSDTFGWVDGLQKDLVSTCLTNRAFFVRTLNLLKPEYFPLRFYQEVTEISQEYFKNRHETIPLSVMQQELSDRFEDTPEEAERYIKDVETLYEESPMLRNLEEDMMNRVVEFAKMQGMKSAILQSVDYLERKDYGKIEELIREALMITPEEDLGQNYFEDFQERIARELKKEDNDYFTTGFPSIDAELNGGLGKDGGLGRKELGMIYAPPGVGKSLWLVKIGAENLKKNKKVLYISLEMSEDRIAARFDALMTMIPERERISKFSVLKQRMDKLREAMNSNLIIKEYPTGMADVNSIRSFITRKYNRDQWKPDLILLDYADLMQPINGKNSELWQKQQRIYEEVRGLAVEENLCIYTASQANRRAREVEIITDNELGDSYGKLRVVDAAWSINQSMDERPKSLGRIFVVKHRNGKAGYLVPMRFDYPTCRMLEIDDMDYQARSKGVLPLQNDGSEGK